MVKHLLCGILLVFTTATGCVTAGTKSPIPIPEAIQQRAQVLEERGEEALAARYWRAIMLHAQKKVTTLQAERDEKLSREMELALAAFEEGHLKEARVHLLKILRLEPMHGEAKALALKMKEGEGVKGVILNGDETPAIIAGRAYRNIHMAPLVAALYPDLSGAGPVIWLPVLDDGLVKAQFDHTRALLDARVLYRNKAYEALLESAEMILSFVPEDDEARYMKNGAAHNLAEAFFKKGQYREALAMYRRVDAYYRDESPRIREILALQKSQRDHEKARFNAARVREAEGFLKAGKHFEARATLLKVEEGTPGRKPLMAQLKSEMDRLAEGHYRRGVSLFLEENLAGAIQCWESCLAYAPGHAKAREAAENARRILEKVQGIGSGIKGGKP